MMNRPTLSRDTRTGKPQARCDDREDLNSASVADSLKHALVTRSLDN